MMIFIDSNILCANYYMQGTSFEIIKKVGTIVIGEVVFDEVMNKYREHLTDQLQKIQKDVDGINRLFPKDKAVLFPEINRDLACEQYKEFLEMFIIESGLSIPEDYPNELSHKEIVERELQRKKPFKSNGAGYRDYLVWRTALNTARSYSSEELHFITENTQDFSDTKNKAVLHPDLQQDLNKVGVAERFHYWPSIRAFIENYADKISKRIDQYGSVAFEIQNNNEGYQFPIQMYINNNIIGKNIDGYDVVYPGYDGILLSLEILSDYLIETLSELNETEYLLDISIDTIGKIRSFAPVTEIPALREYDFDITITSQDNEKFLLESTVGLHIRLRAIYDRVKNSITSIELDDLDDYNCPYCN